jgi:hypothetical protein
MIRFRVRLRIKPFPVICLDSSYVYEELTEGKRYTVVDILIDKVAGVYIHHYCVVNDNGELEAYYIRRFKRPLEAH